MTDRRLWGAAALVLLLSACATTDSTTDPAAQPSDDAIALTSGATAASGAKIKPRKAFRGAKQARKLTLRALPQIAQPGKKKAGAGRAKVALPVQARPKRRTVVTLQVKAGKKWRTLRHASTNNKGHIVLTAPLRRGGKPATYRVRAGKATSPARSTKRWAKATLTQNFNGRKLGNQWGYRQTNWYNALGARECSRAMPRAVRVRGGQARLTVRKDNARKGKCVAKRDGVPLGRYDWRINGHISTEGRFDFKYGFAAARIKFPAKRGQHGSFWMQPSQRDFSKPFRSGKAGAEIDIVESFGNGAGTPGSLGLTTFTYHHNRADGSQQVKTGSWLKNTQQYMANAKAKPWNTYHVYSVEWTPKQYIFRIDGKVTWRSKAGVSQQPQFLILSLLSSDYEIPNLGGDKRLPAHMNVDWVRVWETGR